MANSAMRTGQHGRHDVDGRADAGESGDEERPMVQCSVL
jgi:hypothetical protein